MSAILLKSYDFKGNNNYPFVLPRLKTRGLLFCLSGVTSGVTALTRADAGRVQILPDGKNVATEITFEHVDALRMLYPRHEIGKPIFSSAGGATTGLQMSFFLPFFLPNDKSQVREFADNTVVKVIHSDLTSVLTSAQLDIYAAPDLGANQYDLDFTDFTIQTDTALVQPRLLPSAKNVPFLTVDYDVNHTNFRLSKDGKMVYDVDSSDRNSLSSDLDIVRSLETVMDGDTYAEASANYLPYIARFDRTANIDAMLADEYGISIKSTSTTASGTFATLRMHGATYLQSVQNFAQKTAGRRDKR